MTGPKIHNHGATCNHETSWKTWVTVFFHRSLLFQLPSIWFSIQIEYQIGGMKHTISPTIDKEKWHTFRIINEYNYSRKTCQALNYFEQVRHTAMMNFIQISQLSWPLLNVMGTATGMKQSEKQCTIPTLKCYNKQFSDTYNMSAVIKSN